MYSDSPVLATVISNRSAAMTTRSTVGQDAGSMLPVADSG
jgi:hypothetical protein